MSGVPASSRGSTFNGGTITTPLEVDQGASAASASVLIVKDSGGNSALSVTPDGQVSIFSDGSRQEATLDMQDNTSGNAGHLRFDTFTGVLIGPEASGGTLLQLSPLAAHTGRQLTALDSARAAEALAISVNGYLVVKLHAAPADGELAAGELALWFDQTNGASALKIKAKTANGTVATATVPLT